jgi:HSP20 family protein
MLTVSYEKKTESETKDYKTHRREYSISSFSRSFTLDDNINADGIQAKYEDGVLKLLLPKKEEVKVTPKEITIQ